MAEELRSDYVVEVCHDLGLRSSSSEPLNFKQAAAYAAKAAPEAAQTHESITVWCAGFQAVEMQSDSKVMLVDLDTTFRENERNYIASAMINAVSDAKATS